MPSNRIYLGIDSHSNLALSLESIGDGVFFLTVSEGTRGNDLCKFLCSREDLDGVIHNHPVSISGKAGRCEIHAAGDEVVIHFKRSEDTVDSTCTLTTNSFTRLVTLASNRAYLR